MIFNLVSGTSDAVFKQALHLAARTSTAGDGVTFTGVKAPSGAVNGLVLFANIQSSGADINNIFAILDPSNNANIGYLQSYSNAQVPFNEGVEGLIFYDDELQTLTIKYSRDGGAYLAAGDYTLIIW